MESPRSEGRYRPSALLDTPQKQAPDSVILHNNPTPIALFTETAVHFNNSRMSGSPRSSASRAGVDNGADSIAVGGDVRDDSSSGDVDQQLRNLYGKENEENDDNDDEDNDDETTSPSKKKQRRPRKDKGTTKSDLPLTKAKDSGAAVSSSSSNRLNSNLVSVSSNNTPKKTPEKVVQVDENGEPKKIVRIKIPEEHRFAKNSHGPFVRFKGELAEVATVPGTRFNFATLVPEDTTDFLAAGDTLMKYVNNRTHDVTCLRCRESGWSMNMHASCLCFDRLRNAMESCRNDHPGEDITKTANLMRQFFHDLARLIFVIRTARSQEDMDRAHRYLLMKVIIQAPKSGDPGFYTMSLRFQTEHDSVLELSSFRFCIGFLSELLGSRFPTTLPEAKKHQQAFQLQPETTGLTKTCGENYWGWRQWYIKGAKILNNHIMLGIPTDKQKIRDLIKTEEYTTATPLDRLKLFACKGRSKASKRAFYNRFVASVVGTRQAIFQAVVHLCVTHNLTCPGQKPRLEEVWNCLRDKYGNLMTFSKFQQDYNQVISSVFESSQQLADTTSHFVVAHSSCYYGIRRNVNAPRTAECKWLLIRDEPPAGRKLTHRYANNPLLEKTQDNYFQNLDFNIVMELYNKKLPMTQQQMDIYDFIKYQMYASEKRMRWQQTNPTKPDRRLFQNMVGARHGPRSQIETCDTKPISGNWCKGWKGIILPCKGERAWMDMVHQRDGIVLEVPQVFLQDLDAFAEALYTKFVFDDHGIPFDPKTLVNATPFIRLNGNDNVFVHSNGWKTLSGWSSEVGHTPQSDTLDESFNKQLKQALDPDNEYHRCETFVYLHLNIPDITKQTVENMRTEYFEEQLLSIAKDDNCELNIGFLPLDRHGGSRRVYTGPFPWATGRRFDPVGNKEDSVAANGVIVHTVYGQMTIHSPTVLTSDGYNFTTGTSPYLVVSIVLRNDNCQLRFPPQNRADPENCYYNENGRIPWSDAQKERLNVVQSVVKCSTNRDNPDCNIPSVAYISPAGVRNSVQTLLKKWHCSPNLETIFGPGLMYGQAEDLYNPECKLPEEAIEGHEDEGDSGKDTAAKRIKQLAYYMKIFEEVDDDSDAEDLSGPDCDITRKVKRLLKDVDDEKAAKEQAKNTESAEQAETSQAKKNKRKREKYALDKQKPSYWRMMSKEKDVLCGHCAGAFNLRESPGFRLVFTDKHTSEVCYHPACLKEASLSGPQMKEFVSTYWRVHKNLVDDTKAMLQNRINALPEES